MKKFLFFAFAISMIGCSKDVSNDKTSTQNLSGAPLSKASTYLPLTKGTEWKYTTTSDTGSTIKSTDLVTKDKKNINGQSYTLTLVTSGSRVDSDYYSQQGINYYQYYNFHYSSNQQTALNVLFLKDTTQGAVWDNNAGTFEGYPVISQGQLIKRDYKMSIKDSTYKNVIHTQVTLIVETPFGGLQAGTIDYYTSENIGIIKTVEDFQYPESFTATITLNSYKIK